jgi:hypothetical protein
MCWCIGEEGVRCNRFIEAVHISSWEASLEVLPQRQS